MPTTKKPLADIRIGLKMARIAFQRRGEPSEVHLTEDELARICAATARTVIELLQRYEDGKATEVQS